MGDIRAASASTVGAGAVAGAGEAVKGVAGQGGRQAKV